MANRPLPLGSRIAVIGAGIIGASAAFVLAERGYAVTLVDRDAPGLTGPSWGNAGHVVGSGIFPLAEPGIAFTGMKMLADPDAPLKVPPAYMAQIAPWLWQFWRSSYGDAYTTALNALIGFNRGAVEESIALFQRAGMPERIRHDPALYLYESSSSYAAARAHWKKRDQVGLYSTHVGADEIRRLEPELAPIFTHGVLSHEWAIVTDPYEVVLGYVEAAEARGVMLERGKVEAVEPDGAGVRLTLNGEPRLFDAALISAGVWSRQLADRLGEHLPVEAERGYNLTYPEPKATVQRPLVLADRGVVVTALKPGLRLGGWTELGGTELPPNPSRWGKMREITDAVLPGLRGEAATEWMGHRPSMPDSVPVVSRSRKHPAVFYAVGHGHYGLSWSAKTARAVGELIGEAADQRYAALSIKRFGR